MTMPDDPRLLATVRGTLTREFSGIFSPETIETCLIEFI